MGHCKCFSRGSRCFGFENCRAKSATELEGFHPCWCVSIEPQSHTSDFNIRAVDCCHFLAGVVGNPIHRGGDISRWNHWAGRASESVSSGPGHSSRWCWMIEQEKDKENSKTEQYFQLFVFYLNLAFLNYELSHQYFWITITVSPLRYQHVNLQMVVTSPAPFSLPWTSGASGGIWLMALFCH